MDIVIGVAVGGAIMNWFSKRSVDKKTAVQPSEELLLKEAEALNVSEEEWVNKLKEQNRSFLKIAGEVFVPTSSQAVRQWLEIIQKEKYLIARSIPYDSKDRGGLCFSF